MEKPHRACSACQGDYEDPDRSAWEEDSEPETPTEVGDEPEPTPKATLPGRTQREVLLELLRSAAQQDAWLTLDEMAGETNFPQASISAQLRHLRKPRYGAWKVERQQRKWVGRRMVWEYRLGS